MCAMKTTLRTTALALAAALAVAACKSNYDKAAKAAAEGTGTD